jgi:hypothetical protein
MCCDLDKAALYDRKLIKAKMQSPALPFAGFAHEPEGSGGNSVTKLGFPILTFALTQTLAGPAHH